MPTLKNARQELYCKGIVEGKTSDKAYSDAGYKPSRAHASHLAAKSNIQTRIAELQEGHQERHNVTVDRVLAEYAKLGFSDIRELFDENGAYKHPSALGDAIAGAVAGLEVVTKNKGEGEVEHVAKIRLADKRAALADMGKHLGMFPDKNGGGVQVNLHNNTTNNVVVLSDMELARRLAHIIESAVYDADPS